MAFLDSLKEMIAGKDSEVDIVGRARPFMDQSVLTGGPVGRYLGHGVNTALGALYGAAKTRSLPTTENGNWVFRGDDVQTPVAMGGALTLPRNATARTVAHESRHADQSRALGPAYLPVSMLTGGLGVLEKDAYLNEPELSADPSVAEKDDARASNWMLSDIENADKGSFVNRLAAVLSSVPQKPRTVSR